MRITSHDECKIKVAEAQVTRVRRIESSASLCKYRLHMAAMQQRRVLSNVTVGHVEPYVWYPPQHYGPKKLLEDLDTSLRRVAWQLIESNASRAAAVTFTGWRPIIRQRGKNGIGHHEWITVLVERAAERYQHDHCSN